MTAPAPRIAILGGGTAGWMAACLMARAWPAATVTVIESPAIGIIGVGESSTPQRRGFFAGLGIAEADWMPACNATYKAGIAFHGWSHRPGFERYFHPTAWFTRGDVTAEIERQGIGAYYAPLSGECMLADYGSFPDPAALGPAADRVGLAALDDMLDRCTRNFRDHAATLRELARPGTP